MTPFPLLWKALRLYQVDPEKFMGELGEGKVDEALARLLDEPLLKTLDLDPESLQSLSAEPKLPARWRRCSTSTRTPAASWRT